MANNVIYITDKETSGVPANGEALPVARRGVFLGWLAAPARPAAPDTVQAQRLWAAHEPVLLPAWAGSQVAAHGADIQQAQRLLTAVLDGAGIADLLGRSPYAERLAKQFELVFVSEAEGDDRELEKVHFDAIDCGRVEAEDLWVKAAWLSLYEADASLRLRFSFGMEDYEDVAADFHRQQAAAALAAAVFPESAVIAQNGPLIDRLCQVSGLDRLSFVERIVYFNAPDGGAQWHHDAERGHAGVVYAQVHGRTAWLTCSKATLVAEIDAFLQRPDADALLSFELPQAADRQVLQHWAGDRAALSRALDEPDHEPLEALMNRVPAFIRQLVGHGHAYVLWPGDVLLLPQLDSGHCAWHTVFCVDDHAGEGLSFAVREAPAA